MSRTYKAIGINLKSMPMGESDRLLTVLTREFGLVQVLAMGARKHNSSLSGRSGLFVVNHLLIAKGKTLDKLTQAETIESFPKLAQDLKKLTASQYLAELCLCQALSDQPQEQLFDILNQHLKQLERSPSHLILPYLTYAIFQLLILEGVAPQVYRCCLTQAPLLPDVNTPNWQAGFSAAAGGTVSLEALQQLNQKKPAPILRSAQTPVAREQRVHYNSESFKRGAPSHRSISALELSLLQAIAQLDPVDLANPSLDQAFATAVHPAVTQTDWLTVERLLRQYAQYHFDRPIRSAALVDTCFSLSS
ncbi:MAG: DNA repair protein RecO [Leptolyngbyaceae cyanobacterium bins.302]|nr:DNA repair protein RecO [Leptolyngbyaceae cyanobacterium bins.302]